jgi:hypothetical protein
MDRRWMMAVCGGFALGACQVDSTSRPQPQTTQIEQALDCTPGQNFCGVVMPQAPWWNGQAPPQAGSGAGFIIWEHKPGEWLGMLADTQQASIPWARRTQAGNLAAFVGAMSLKGSAIVMRPPPPPPWPPDGTDWWKARVGLEAQLRVLELPFEASDAASCPQK